MKVLIGAGRGSFRGLRYVCLRLVVELRLIGLLVTGRWTSLWVSGVRELRCCVGSWHSGLVYWWRLTSLPYCFVTEAGCLYVWVFAQYS